MFRANLNLLVFILLLFQGAVAFSQDTSPPTERFIMIGETEQYFQKSQLIKKVGSYSVVEGANDVPAIPSSIQERSVRPNITIAQPVVSYGEIKPEMKQQLRTDLFAAVQKYRFSHSKFSYSGKGMSAHLSFWKGQEQSPANSPLGRYDVSARADLSLEKKNPFDNGLFDIDIVEPRDEPPPPIVTGFQWRSAMKQSLLFLGIQHGFALATQERTRKALANGNFFVDYYRSVKAINGWDDGGKFFTNYVAHPMQGAMTGYIFVQNDPKSINLRFGSEKEYWISRSKALLWSTAWSTQFELGPISQSSIGNVGMAGKMGFVDLVVTPTVGTGWLIVEDALDRFLIRKIERMNNFALKLIFRILFNPVRSTANLIRMREPWYRDRPPGI